MAIKILTKTQGIFAILHNFVKTLGFKKIEFQNSFNRNLFFFTGKGEPLKTEFTYFPFEPLQWGSKLLLVDSLEDYPRLIKKIDIEKMKAFFIKEAKGVGETFI